MLTEDRLISNYVAIAELEEAHSSHMTVRSKGTLMVPPGASGSPGSPWQNPYAERLIGSLRRECLDHVIILNEQHLRRVWTSYLTYYHGSRTHLSLQKDPPIHRRPQAITEGHVVAFAEIGGLHHRYERRRAA